jgi:hypothetical protein
MATELRKIIIRKGSAAQFEQLELEGGGLDEAEFGFTTDTNRLFIGVGSGISKEIATATHMEDQNNPHNVTLEQVGGEPAFTKNTAFNKNFGTTAGTVAEGNHIHTFAQITSKPTTLAGYGITDADTSTQVDTKITNAINTLIGTADETLDTLGEIATRLQTVEIDLGTAEGNIDTQAGAINTLQGDLANLSDTVDDNTDAIETNRLATQSTFINNESNLLNRITKKSTLLGSVSSDDEKTVQNYTMTVNVYPTRVIKYRTANPTSGDAGSAFDLWLNIQTGTVFTLAGTGDVTPPTYNWTQVGTVIGWPSVTQLSDTVYYVFNNIYWQVQDFASLSQGELQFVFQPFQNDPNFEGIYQSTVTYNTGEIVVSSGNYYQSVVDSNTGNLLTNTDFWTLLTIVVPQIVTIQKGMYEMLYFTYQYYDSILDLNLRQSQIFDITDLGWNDIKDTIYFMSPKSTPAYIKATQLGSGVLEIRFPAMSQANDVQQIFMYGFTNTFIFTLKDANEVVQGTLTLANDTTLDKVLLALGLDPTIAIYPNPSSGTQAYNNNTAVNITFNSTMYTSTN